jgi:glycosyltransferase involved in cell wall biosynthesis
MRICFISNSITWVTGFSHQVKNLGLMFKKMGHEVWNICERPSEETYLINEVGFERYDPNAIDRELFAIQPDIVISLNGFVPALFWKSLLYTGQCKFFFWLPYESVIAMDQHKTLLEGVPKESIVFISNYANRLFGGGYNVIHHCYGPNERDDSILEKLSLRPQEYIIGVNRNEYRKRWDLFFKAAARYQQAFGKRKVLVHTNPEGFYPIKSLAAMYGIEQILTKYAFSKGISHEQLMSLYHHAEIKIDTTGGEGFGLTLLDSIRAGTHVMAGDHTCVPEVLGEYYAKLPVYGFCGNTSGVYANVDPTIEDIERFMADACDWRDINHFSPENIANQWLGLASLPKSVQYPWGYSGEEIRQQQFKIVADFASAIGNSVTELGGPNEKLIEACLFKGLDVESVGVYDGPPSRVARCIKTAAEHNLVAVITDEPIEAPLNFQWVLIRDGIPNKKPILSADFMSAYKRRPELEETLRQRNGVFLYKIYSKSDINPL